MILRCMITVQTSRELVNIGHDHFVYGNKKEIEEYRAIREKGVPLKSINIVDPDAPQAQKRSQKRTPTNCPLQKMNF